MAVGRQTVAGPDPNFEMPWLKDRFRIPQRPFPPSHLGRLFVPHKRPSRPARKLAQLRGLRTFALSKAQASGPLATTIKLGRASAALVLCATLNAATGLLKPFRSRFPRSSSLTTASTAPAMRLLTRIWPSLASAQSRAARLHTVPIAV